MKINDAPIRRQKSQATTPHSRPRLRSQGKSRMTISALTATLLSLVCVMVFCANTVSSQNLRRQMRIQRKIDRKKPRPAGNPNKLTPSDSGNEEPGAPDQPDATAPSVTDRQPGHSVDGIRQRGLQSFFTQEEQSLWIPTFSNRAALLMIFQQLGLTPEQIVQKQAEWFKLHKDIESQFQQILTPDQFYIYHELMIDAVRPGNRPLVNPGARQQQRQRRMGVQPNPQNRPNQQDQPD